MVKLDLSHLPPIHVLPARFSEEELHTLEAQLQECGANLTYSHHEADLYLADLNTPRRCELELRKRGLWTKQFETGNPVAQSDDGNRAAEKGKEKRKERQDDARIIKVVKLKWFTQSFAEEVMADMARFIVYTGRVVPAPENGGTDGASAPTTPVKNNAQTIYSVFQHTLPVSRRSPTSATQPTKKPRLDTSSPTHSSPSPARIDARKHVEGILERAQRDAQEHRGKDGAGGGGWRFRGGHYQSRRRHDSRARADEITRINHQPSPKLEHLTTKEWEDDQLVQHTREMPEYVKKGVCTLYYYSSHSQRSIDITKSILYSSSNTPASALTPSPVPTTISSPFSEPSNLAAPSPSTPSGSAPTPPPSPPSKPTPIHSSPPPKPQSFPAATAKPPPSSTNTFNPPPTPLSAPSKSSKSSKQMKNSKPSPYSGESGVLARKPLENSTLNMVGGHSMTLSISDGTVSHACSKSD